MTAPTTRTRCIGGRSHWWRRASRNEVRCSVCGRVEGPKVGAK